MMASANSAHFLKILQVLQDSAFNCTYSHITMELKQTEIFEKKLHKLIPKQYHSKLVQRCKKLTKKPFTGKPLGYTFLRELKIKKWRCYFLIDKDTVYLLDISDKKMQKETIKNLKENFLK